ncbi:MAG TPA: M15 family metallopeptidase, partial [Vicinamibacterales bacterium]|nr:M15 family metallopeptidase [Vicinamibacterales bacterium]
MRGALLAVGLLAPGCAGDDGNGTGAPPHAAIVRAAATVGSYTNSTGCSTSVVIGLSKQIAQEAGCENPNSFVSFQGASGITLASSAVLPYLVKDARDDLKTVAASNSLTVTSALRTLAQQYLLYEWYLQGRCGITAAATVGNSNHEGGRAVDLSNYSTRISAMAAHGWAHDVSGDPVHFDHTASADDRSQDTHAFQVLWNLNHPGDQITVDGIYGPQTEARLVESPAAGFAQGATCLNGSGSGGSASSGSAADLVSVDGPEAAPPDTLEHYTLVVKNAGTTDWPAGT